MTCKFIVSILVGFFSIVSAQAASFEVVGIAGRILLKKNVRPEGSVGRLSNQILLDSLHAGVVREYSGSDGGVASVNGLKGALEVLSPTEMNSYGWCYWVDGIESGLMADEFQLTGKERSIKWFYAYAHLKDGVWLEMCAPADHFPRR